MTSPLAARQRAFHLLEQGRADLAEPELRRALASEPDNAELHAFLALALADLERGKEALAEAEQAVGLEPDWGFAHYARATALLELGRPSPAAQAAREALRLDPADALALVKLAAALYDLRKHHEALEAVEQALALDPEDPSATNLRAAILVRMDRRDEAAAAVEGVLARAPEDATSHANMGWTLLHQGRPREAMEAFRESLRLDPANDWARSGIVEAMKARNPVYRVLLRYYLWMDRLSGGARWGVLIGGYLIAKAFPPLLVVYLPAVLLTWVGDPLFNLLLFLDPFGRLVLSRDERVGAALVGACLGGSILAGLAALAGGGGLALATALILLTLSVPVAATASRPPGRRRFAGAYTVGLLALGLACIGVFLTGDEETATVLGGAYGLGFAAFTWLGNLITR